jgi:hypothetical protein
MESRFEKILKSKLYEADTPIGYEADWDGFVAFRERKKKERRKRALVIISRSVAALFVLTISVIGLTRVTNEKNRQTLLSRGTPEIENNIQTNGVSEKITGEPITEVVSPGLISENVPEEYKMENVSKELALKNVAGESYKANNPDEMAPEKIMDNPENFERITPYSIGLLSLEGFYSKKHVENTNKVAGTLYDLDEYLGSFDNINTDDPLSEQWSTSIFANALAMNSAYNEETPMMAALNGIPVLSADKQYLNTAYANYGIDGQGVLTSESSNYYKDYLINHPPLIVSATVSRSILPKIDLSTGLVYTYLRSEYTEYSSFNSYSQKLHYLGIPVSVSYNLLSDKSRYSLYTVGGLLFQKALLASGTTKVFDGAVLELYNKTSLKTPEIMVSANMGLGVGYDIINNFGIYLESYVSYYFYTKEQPVSFLTANDISLNMKIGLKYKF